MQSFPGRLVPVDNERIVNKRVTRARSGSTDAEHGTARQRAELQNEVPLREHHEALLGKALTFVLLHSCMRLSNSFCIKAAFKLSSSFILISRSTSSSALHVPLFVTFISTLSFFHPCTLPRTSLSLSVPLLDRSGFLRLFFHVTYQRVQ